MTYTWIFAAALLLAGCDSYLEKTPDADVTEEDIFRNYKTFQGYIDQCYTYLVDYNSHALTTGAENGDHSTAFQGWASANKYTQGRYWDFMSVMHSNYWSNAVDGIAENDSGIWPDGWRGIRAANMALEKLGMLVAADEEISLIEGQAYFFRAYMHWEVAKRWGGLPYVDQVFGPTDDNQLPRLTFQETVERIVEDLDMAASLLPNDWDDTQVGGLVSGFNAGRATKGAAIAFKAEALMWAGSPLGVGSSGGAYDYDADYMMRAAQAAAEVIKMANAGVYVLVPFSSIQDNFAKMDGTWPWTTETIFQKVTTISGSGLQNNRHGRLYTTARFGGNGICETATQNLVDMYEMASTGLPYDDPESGYNENQPWDGRDPRFREFLLVDGDLAGLGDDTKVEMFEEGVDKKDAGVLTSYMVRKFWPRGCNKYDALWSQFRNVTPHMRLAEIYLIYAEAVNEAMGPAGTAGGLSLTAVDAVNVVRDRAGMPVVHSKFIGDKESFRARIWNERSVELCFEGPRGNDIRRWYIGHLPETKVLYDLEFDKEYTYFNRVIRVTRIFDQKHYWMPFPRAQTEIYDGFFQNPGW